MGQHADKAVSLEGRWQFAEDVPVSDWLDRTDLSDASRLGELLDNTVFYLGRGHFLTWEAVVCRELGLPLTAKQEDALGGLIDYNDKPGEDRVLYIDGLERPKQLWYEIVRAIVPHLLMPVLKTFDVHYDVVLEGWPRLAEAVENNGSCLSLPGECDSPLGVVPADLRHGLWLQTCCDALCGLGQNEELTLADEHEYDRIDNFVDALRAHKDSVVFLGLTLEKLLKTLILPPMDTPIFVRLMLEKLRLPSTRIPIADHL